MAYLLHGLALIVLPSPSCRRELGRGPRWVPETRRGKAPTLRHRAWGADLGKTIGARLLGAQQCPRPREDRGRASGSQRSLRKTSLLLQQLPRIGTGFACSSGLRLAKAATRVARTPHAGATLHVVMLSAAFGSFAVAAPCRRAHPRHDSQGAPACGVPACSADRRRREPALSRLSGESDVGANARPSFWAKKAPPPRRRSALARISDFGSRILSLWRCLFADFKAAPKASAHPSFALAS